MYEQEIARAVNAVKTMLVKYGTNIPSGADQTGRAYPFLNLALRALVTDLRTALLQANLGGFVDVFMRSNYLTRAAADFYGPALCAGMLTERTTYPSSIGRLTYLFFATVVYEIDELMWVDIPDPTRSMLRHVIRAHVDYAVEMATRLHRDRAVLAKAYGVSGLPSIMITSSDPHTCAERVAILTYTDGTCVYKPTDLTFQATLIGDGASYKLSTHLRGYKGSLFTRLGLPTLRIVAIPAARGKYGYMEFKTRCTDFTTSGLTQHFVRLGNLAAIAALFGISDLHEENIMATANGPVVIDAEMTFAVPKAKDKTLLTKTGITRCLAPPKNYASVLGGFFQPYYDARGRDGERWEANKLSLPHTIDDVNVCVKRTGTGAWADGKDYAKEFYAGMCEACDFLLLRHALIKHWFVELESINPRARIPFDTTEMGMYYAAGIADALNGTLPTAPQAILKGCAFWLSRFAGIENATPGAWVNVRNVNQIYDPRGTPGILRGALPARMQLSSAGEVASWIEQIASFESMQRIKVIFREAVAAELGVHDLPKPIVMQQVVELVQRGFL